MSKTLADDDMYLEIAAEPFWDAEHSAWGLYRYWIDAQNRPHVSVGDVAAVLMPDYPDEKACDLAMVQYLRWVIKKGRDPLDLVEVAARLPYDTVLRWDFQVGDARPGPGVFVVMVRLGVTGPWVEPARGSEQIQDYLLLKRIEFGKTTIVSVMEDFEDVDDLISRTMIPKTEEEFALASIAGSMMNVRYYQPDSGFVRGTVMLDVVASTRVNYWKPVDSGRTLRMAAKRMLAAFEEQM